MILPHPISKTNISLNSTCFEFSLIKTTSTRSSIIPINFFMSFIYRSWGHSNSTTFAAQKETHYELYGNVWKISSNYRYICMDLYNMKQYQAIWRKIFIHVLNKLCFRRRACSKSHKNKRFTGSCLATKLPWWILIINFFLKRKISWNQ